MTRTAEAAADPAVVAGSRPPIAWRVLLLLAGALVAVLVGLAGRYGYHRDELYFLQAGRNPAFGYVDQPPLTPLLARAADALFGGSLVGLRVPAALAAGAAVLVTGITAREFGAGKPGQLLAAACVAVSAYLLAVGHLMSTSTVDLLIWTTLCWLVLRALRDGGRAWLRVGLLAGIGLENKLLVAFLLAALLAGVLTVGPRDTLRSRSFAAAAGIAVLLWLPNLIWQARHGWPQLSVSGSIAAGGSGTSASRAVFLPMQLLLVSPLLVPVWLAGLWRLTRSPAAVRYRSFPVAYLLLAVVFLATGGKPYYLGGMYPVLLAAGAEPTVRWMRATGSPVRTRLLAAAVGVTALISALLFLPVVPVTALQATPIVAINYDAGETVGWPEFAATVAGVYAGLPPAERAHTVALAGNYGEAGALDHYRRAGNLPAAYSGHNSYFSWGPPAAATTTVLAVGFRQATLGRWFADITPAARIDNGVGVDNDEQHQTVWVCRQLRQPWTTIWPQLRHYG